LVPDPDTFVVLPYAPRSGQMLVNMVELDHSPWALDPRAFLQRMVAKAAEAGLTFDAAFENEFYLAVRTEDGYRPVDQSLCFSAIGMESTEEVIQDIIAALTEQGLTVELSHPELGWGQQELSIRHAPALSAADNQITYRQTVRAVAGEHGLIASLAPKPFADQAGSGAHLHWSIWDKDHTMNKLAEGGGENGLSELARNAIAGVLAHLPGLLGLTTPSTNSFRRLQPHYWSSAYTAWGIENREAAVRVPSRYWDDEAGSANLELKASDASANPYISLGGVMAAALDGIERGLDPGRAGRPGPRQSERRGARQPRHPSLPGDGGGSPRRARGRSGADRRPGGAIGRRIPQGPARRGRRVRRARRRLGDRTALLQVLIGRFGCPSTSRRSRSSTTTATRCCASSRDDEAFRIHLTESYFPEVARDDVPHSLFYQWTIRELAGCSTSNRRPTPCTRRVAHAGSSG
jgi:glutamine synthetase